MLDAAFKKILHRRLHQIKYNDTLVLGSIVVVLIWNTGKMPAVRGRVMREKTSKTDNDISGLNMKR